LYSASIVHASKTRAENAKFVPSIITSTRQNFKKGVESLRRLHIRELLNVDSPKKAVFFAFALSLSDKTGAFQDALRRNIVFERFGDDPA